MTDKLILLMYESWAGLYRALDGLTVTDATARHGGGSSVAWTVGHVTNMVDSWINVRFQGLPQHPTISNPDFRTGGSGEAKDWPIIAAGMQDVHERARHFLDTKPGLDLDHRIPYNGSIEFLRPIGLSLRYSLMRIAAHHFEHVGEIRTIRSRLGHVFPENSDWGRSLV